MYCQLESYIHASDTFTGIPTCFLKVKDFIFFCHVLRDDHGEFLSEYFFFCNTVLHLNYEWNVGSL